MKYQSILKSKKPMIDFNRIWIDIECSKCKYIVEFQMIDVKTGKTIFCHNCKINIELEDNSASVHTGLESINNAMQKLENTLKKQGR